MHRRLSILLLSGVFLLSALGCSLGSTVRRAIDSEVQPPQRTVVVDANAAAEAKIAVQAGLATGEIRLSESQFTSLLVELLAENADASNILSSPTIWFDPGVIYIQAKVNGGAELPLSGNVLMSGAAAAQEGRLRIDLQKALVSGVPVPGSVLDSVEQQLNEWLVRPETGGLNVRNVRIEQGVMVIEVGG